MRKLRSLIKLVLWLLCIFVVANLVLTYYLPLEYEDEIQRIAKENHVDPALICALIKTESSFNKDAISSKHALGLTQLMPSTIQYISEKYDIPVTIQSVFEPETNIRVGVMYLKDLMDRFGDEDLALMAYNAGPSVVRRWIEEGKLLHLDAELQAVPYPETRNYVLKIRKTREYYDKYLRQPYRIPKEFKRLMHQLRHESQDVLKKAKEKLGENLF
ncbi:MAG: lytic transglycosylase domain-containing protein [Tissierellia bacterium]|nr:lytic transglycosylase domain-containing protein [Tissierellia bacterium]